MKGTVINLYVLILIISFYDDGVALRQPVPFANQLVLKG